jgi:uncharacterized protein (DUF2236 family)
MSTGPSVGLLQLMHPAIRAAVDQHSAFTDQPFQRVIRSIPQIWSTLLTPNGTERARSIRDLHAGIGGRLPDGNRYHALDPATFWWAHASFTWGVFRSVELFHWRQLTRGEQERLYADTVVWYRRYGVSERVVPATYADFLAEFDRVCDEVLDVPPALRTLVASGSDGITRAAVSTLGPSGIAAGALAPVVDVLVIGCLPERLRERWFADRWTPWRRRAFEAIRLESRWRSLWTPAAVDRWALRRFLRHIGARTRHDRYQGG